MPQVIPASPGNNIVLSIDYAPGDASLWARLFDNPALGWVVDETGATPAQPVVIGALPPVADTGAPILSPQWATFNDPAVFVPDLLRANLPDFLTWLATNNGAQRPLQARFGLHSGLANGFDAWARANPGLVFEGDPPEPPAAEGESAPAGRGRR